MLSWIFTLMSNLIHVMLGVGTPDAYPPPLPPEEEKRHFLLASNGNEDSRQTLILHNLRLVSHIVRKYYSSSDNQEDLVSIGTIGLVKAVDSFKCESGTRFATFAAKCIQNEILMYFRSRKKMASEVSIHETIDIDKEGHPLTYIDVICSDESFADEVDTKICIEKMMGLVDSILSERERQIIVLRYGLFDTHPHTQRETAEKLGISRSYVSRIEKGALDKLLCAMQKNG